MTPSSQEIKQLYRLEILHAILENPVTRHEVSGLVSASRLKRQSVVNVGVHALRLLKSNNRSIKVIYICNLLSIVSEGTKQILNSFTRRYVSFAQTWFPKLAKRIVLWRNSSLVSKKTRARPGKKRTSFPDSMSYMCWKHGCSLPQSLPSTAYFVEE
ncbi:hypothetical protein J6590_057342 [Homalodisca vitripennis]|nr:hypothetical protein J6590_057342 [Homalodisca vitripennis]